jgi:enediyne biosynthesis protein E5
MARLARRINGAVAPRRSIYFAAIKGSIPASPPQERSLARLSLIARLALPSDARWFQIAGQTAILLAGLGYFDFRIGLPQILAAIGASLTAQALGTLLVAGRYDWKSALITGLSLCLLLRANDVWPFVAAAFIGTGSKFALRRGGRHVFNPANIGIVLMIAFSGAAWTSTGEWGSAPWFSLFIAALGGLVCWRASRLDAAIIYLGVFALLVVGRALYLGDPLSIPALRLSHGALILFAFFMISDPKTTPEDLRERALFVALAALIAYILQFHFFISDGIFYAPFLLALIRFIALKRAANGYEWGDPPRAHSVLRRPRGPHPAE